MKINIIFKDNLKTNFKGSKNKKEDKEEERKEEVRKGKTEEEEGGIGGGGRRRSSRRPWSRRCIEFSGRTVPLEGHGLKEPSWGRNPGCSCIMPSSGLGLRNHVEEAGIPDSRM